MMLSKAHAVNGNEEKSKVFAEKATKRKEAILQYCWDDQQGFFVDYDFIKRNKYYQRKFVGNITNQNHGNTMGIS